jgi:hypothetical protein
MFRRPVGGAKAVMDSNPDFLGRERFASVGRFREHDVTQGSFPAWIS